MHYDAAKKYTRVPRKLHFLRPWLRVLIFQYEYLIFFIRIAEERRKGYLLQIFGMNSQISTVHIETSIFF